MYQQALSDDGKVTTELSPAQAGMNPDEGGSLLDTLSTFPRASGDEPVHGFKSDQILLALSPAQAGMNPPSGLD